MCVFLFVSEQDASPTRERKPRGFVINTIDGQTRYTHSFLFLTCVDEELAVGGPPVPVAAASPAKWLSAPVLCVYVCVCVSESMNAAVRQF